MSFLDTQLATRTDKSRHTHTEMRHDTRDGERHTCPMFDALLVTYSGMCVESYPRDTILFRLIQPQCSIFGLLENQM